MINNRTDLTNAKTQLFTEQNPTWNDSIFKIFTRFIFTNLAILYIKQPWESIASNF